MRGVHEGTFLCLSLSGKGPTARSIRTRGSNDRTPAVDDTERRLAERISTSTDIAGQSHAWARVLEGQGPRHMIDMART